VLRTTEKAVLMVCCVAGIIVTLLLWSPYVKVSTLSLEYVRGQAVKWARCLEQGLPLSLDVPAFTEQESVTIKVELPNESPLVVTAIKAKLKVPCPEASGSALVYGPPTSWSSERRARVYQEQGYVVLELLPRVQMTTTYEAGAKVYLVRVELFRLDLPQGPQLEPHKAVAPKGSQELIYARGYDYSGTSRVYLNGEQVGSLSVVKGDGARVVVAYELWG